METTIDFVVPSEDLSPEELANAIERALIANADTCDFPLVAKPLPSGRRVRTHILVIAGAIIAAASTLLLQARSESNQSGAVEVAAPAPSPLVDIHSVDQMPASIRLHLDKEREFLLNDALEMRSTDAALIAWVGKYTHDHEWIWLRRSDQSDQSGLFVCPAEGIYIDLSQAQSVRQTRSQFLASPSVRAFLYSLPALHSGGKTPPSWGRDTSYGGKRGVAQVQRLIDTLIHESQK